MSIAESFGQAALLTRTGPEFSRGIHYGPACHKKRNYTIGKESKEHHHRPPPFCSIFVPWLRDTKSCFFENGHEDELQLSLPWQRDWEHRFASDLCH